jgi:hypothetical protein
VENENPAIHPGFENFSNFGGYEMMKLWHNCDKTYPFFHGIDFLLTNTRITAE